LLFTVPAVSVVMQNALNRMFRFGVGGAGHHASAFFPFVVSFTCFNQAQPCLDFSSARIQRLSCFRHCFALPCCLLTRLPSRQAVTAAPIRATPISITNSLPTSDPILASFAAER
jgi:hypothetical protein